MAKLTSANYNASHPLHHEAPRAFDHMRGLLQQRRRNSPGRFSCFDSPAGTSIALFFDPRKHPCKRNTVRECGCARPCVAGSNKATACTVSYTTESSLPVLTLEFFTLSFGQLCCRLSMLLIICVPHTSWDLSSRHYIIVFDRIAVMMCHKLVSTCPDEPCSDRCCGSDCDDRILRMSMIKLMIFFHVTFSCDT